MSLNFKNIIRVISIIAIYWSGLLFAFEKPVEIIEPVDDKSFLPTATKYADWVFMGVVENESGEIYNYAFQMQRNDSEFHATVLLIDGQTKKVIFEDDSTAIIDNPNNYKWAVGKSFLRFNKITGSWVFGLKNANKEGFNFKVSMLNTQDVISNRHKLNGKITYIIAQVGQLNGHIKIGGEQSDQFVTAKSGLFRQLELLEENINTKALNSLLCRFSDGRSLYSMSLVDSGKVQNMIAGLFDVNGKSLTVSQFVSIKDNLDNSWKIKIPTPKIEFLLKNLSQNDKFVSGFMTGISEGFCTLSTDSMMAKNISPPTSETQTAPSTGAETPLPISGT
jgi:hypothetical protein